MSPLGQYYPISEASVITKRSTSTLRNQIQAGRIKARKIGDQWFIHLSELKNKYPEAFESKK